MGTVEITHGKQITVLKASLITDHVRIAAWIQRRLEAGPVSITDLFSQARLDNIRDKSLNCVLNTLVRDHHIRGDEAKQTYALGAP